MTVSMEAPRSGQAFFF